MTKKIRLSVKHQYSVTLVGKVDIQALYFNISVFVWTLNFFTKSVQHKEVKKKESLFSLSTPFVSSHVGNRRYPALRVRGSHQDGLALH